MDLSMEQKMEKQKKGVCPPLRVAYYPGCTLKANAKNFEDSALSVAKEFGIEMNELPRWNCCGTVFSLASDDLMHHIAPVRILLRARQEGYDTLVTLCSMCYHTLGLSNLRVKENPADLEKINNLMYKEEITYDGKITVSHFLSLLRDQIGFEEIAKKVTSSLNRLKIAPYYGCLLLRPKEISIDPSIENPTVMSDLIRACGGTAIEFPHQTECCGAYLTVDNKELVSQRSYEILESARTRGADCLMTSCPLCQFNLDDRQKEIKKAHPDFEEIPVLYFTQVLAMALGLDKQALGFDLNYVDPQNLLARSNSGSTQ